MRKIFLLMSIFMFVHLFSNAQSKVFKEVSDEISSQIKLIMQDNALVGYLVFTQLEKASADSFNYKITIMDENLNDIGTVNFKEENLDLHSVSFEQDVICLAYLRSNIIGKAFKNRREYRAALPKAKNEVFTQFLNLDGKIIKTNSIKAEIDMPDDLSYDMATNKSIAGGRLKEKIQLRNIGQKGFACFYGDETSNYLSTYDFSGKELWKKKIAKGKYFYLHTSGESIYILSKTSYDSDPGGFEISGYGFQENVSYDKIALKDKKGNRLSIMRFDNDPTTGKPYITGNIINPRNKGIGMVRDVTKGPYFGVYTININGPKKADVKEVYSYWNDGSNPSITTRGKFSEADAYSVLNDGFKDYKGNTYFVGSSVIKRQKWGTIASSVILAPLLIPPVILLATGTIKCKITDAMVLRQGPDGKLVYDNTIPCNSTRFRPGRAPMVMYGPQKTFYRVSNSNTKTDYVIVDDIKDIVVYNVTQKKVAKTIPHKDGNVRTYIYPAKEGHVLVSEYNKKEKYTRFSIESL